MDNNDLLQQIFSFIRFRYLSYYDISFSQSAMDNNDHVKLRVRVLPVFALAFVTYSNRRVTKLYFCFDFM
jgi:hypothetical protein